MIAFLARVQTEEIVPMESAIMTVLAKLDLQTKTVPQVGFIVSYSHSEKKIQNWSNFIFKFLFFVS